MGFPGRKMARAVAGGHNPYPESFPVLQELQ